LHQGGDGGGTRQRKQGGGEERGIPWYGGKKVADLPRGHHTCSSESSAGKKRRKVEISRVLAAEEKQQNRVNSDSGRDEWGRKNAFSEKKGLGRKCGVLQKNRLKEHPISCFKEETVFALRKKKRGQEGHI